MRLLPGIICCRKGCGWTALTLIIASLRVEPDARGEEREKEKEKSWREGEWRASFQELLTCWKTRKETMTPSPKQPLLVYYPRVEWENKWDVFLACFLRLLTSVWQSVKLAKLILIAWGDHVFLIHLNHMLWRFQKECLTFVESFNWRWINLM